MAASEDKLGLDEARAKRADLDLGVSGTPLSRERRAMAGDADSDAGMTSSTADRDGEVTLDSIHQTLALVMIKFNELNARVGQQDAEIRQQQSTIASLMSLNESYRRRATEAEEKVDRALVLGEAHKQAAIEARKLAESASTTSQTALETAHHAEETSATAMERSTEASAAASSAEASAAATEVMATGAREASTHAEEVAARAETRSDENKAYIRGPLLGWLGGHRHIPIAHEDANYAKFNF